MKAFKCDRCGKLFEYKSTRPGTNYDIVTNPNNSASCLDLCNECFNELQEWMAVYSDNKSESEIEKCKCFICNKEIQRDSIPRIEPRIDRIKLGKDEEYPVCDTCGNSLSVVFNKMMDTSK